MGFNRDKASRMKRKGPGKGASAHGPKKVVKKSPKVTREPTGEPIMEEQDGEVAMAEGQPAAQVTPQAHPKTTADAGPDTVDAAANLATLAAVTEWLELRGLPQFKVLPDRFGPERLFGQSVSSNHTHVHARTHTYNSIHGRIARPRLASPRLASHRLAPPHSHRHASPKLA